MAADSDKTTNQVGGSYRIESLRGAENYVPWKVQMEDILVDMGFWEYVSGELKRPADSDAVALSKWKTNDRKALTQIRTRVTEAMITYVMSAKTSKEAWDAIKSMFEVSGPIAAVLIRRKLFRYTMEEGASMEEQVRILRGYQEQLIALDSAVSNKDFAFILLTALPDSWDPFVTALDTSDLETNKLIGRILAEDNQRKEIGRAHV